MHLNTFFKSLILSFSLAFLMAPVQAQPAGAQGDNFVYVVQRDDTIAILAERFTSKPSHWREIKAYNKITNVHSIPIGKQILIPFKYIDTFPERGQVSSIVGSVFVNDQPLALHDYVEESQEIKTGPDSSVTFSLANGSSVSIAPDSVVTIHRLRTFSGTGLIDAIFNAKVGSFSANVNSANVGVGRFEIRTPVSITGIRGTQLRNHIDAEGNTIVELLHGKTDISATKRPDQRRALEQNQGIQISSTGKVGTSQELPAKPSFQAQADPINHELKLLIQAVPDTQHYLVRFTSDEEGLRELARFTTSELENTVSLPSAAQRYFYVQVRSVNKQGMGGADSATRIQLAIQNEAESLVTLP